MAMTAPPTLRDGPDGRRYDMKVESEFAAWEKAWADHLKQTVAPPITFDKRNGGGTPDMSPEAVEARRLAKAREAEALAYVANYRGRWGLPLDIRADRRWGSAKMSLTERQVDALLAGKARDAAYVAKARHPRHDEAAAAVVEAVGRGNTSNFMLSLRAQLADGRTLSERQVEAVLRNAPRADGTPAGEVTDGMYKMADGTIAKVQKAVNGSGNLYAKRLVVSDDGGRFEYVPGLIKRLRLEDRMTLEDAAAFGRLYGWCCVCGRTLTDDDSIAAGIGPVCAKGGGW